MSVPNIVRECLRIPMNLKRLGYCLSAIAASFLFVMPAQAALFGQKLEGNIRDGFYFLTRKTGNPRLPYEVLVSVIVYKGRVISDRSDLQEDLKYACDTYDRACNDKTRSAKNKYSILNSSQILRTLPDGQRFVLTWDKKYPEN